MQKLCEGDASGRGQHCFCMEVDPRSGVRKCCRCNRWNIQGRDWTDDSDFR